MGTFMVFNCELIFNSICTLDFNKKKEDVTNEVDRTLHFKKTFIKTYEEAKIKHSNFLRK